MPEAEGSSSMPAGTHIPPTVGDPRAQDGSLADTEKPQSGLAGEATGGVAALASRLEGRSLEALDLVVDAIGGAKRPGQVQMIEEICRSILAEDRVMIQAGTGTGKSLGYLIPSLVYAADEHAKTLISTATLALQRQILTKDAPVAVEAVRQVTGIAPSVAVLKGWANYLCLNKVLGGYPQEDGTLFDGASAVFDSPTSDLGREVLRLRRWSKKTTTGDRDDLTPGVSDRAWRQVSVQRRECLSKSCPMLEDCFPNAAREQALMADVIVTNHSLVGINAMSAGELFPEVELVVIDEAHDLAERVRHQTSVEFSERQLLRTARVARTHAQANTDALDQAAVDFGLVLGHIEDGLITQRSDELHAAMLTIDAAARDISTQITEAKVDAAGKQLARAAIDELIAGLDAWNRPVDASITWVTRPWREGEIGAPLLIVAPLDVAPPIGTIALGEGAAVLTSATLSLGNSFDAVAQQNGLMVSPIPWRGVDVGTPFSPEKQGILYLPQHLKEPSQSGVAEDALAELVHLAKASGGGVLALFSSWKGVEEGARVLREHTDLRVLVHGESTVSSLVEEFREDRDSCLVGTMSLWQGVDVPGPACRLVVIDRIPFPRPNDPIVQARSRDAEKRGYSGFNMVSRNHAALMMAQASGRLLRSLSDRGVVAVLDKRMVTRGYGGFIRDSMQPLWPTSDREVVYGALERLRESLDEA